MLPVLLWTSFVSAAVLVVNSTVDEKDDTSRPGCNIVSSPTTCTLRAAFEVANQNKAVGHTIALDSSLTGAPFYLTRGEIPIENTALNVFFPSPKVTIIAQPGRRIFNAKAGSKMSMYNMILTQGNGSKGGCFAAYQSDITLNGFEFENCTATFQGGAMNVVSSNLYINQSRFIDNEVTDRAKTSFGGGAIYLIAGPLTINNSYFAGNEASYGGAITHYRSVHQVTDTTFSGNHAEYMGGAIKSVDQSYVNVRSSTFSGNTARNTQVGYGNGGAIDSYASRLEVIDSSFQGNTAENDGGAIDFGGDSNPVNGLAVSDTRFGQNISLQRRGGGINVKSRAGYCQIAGSEFSGNIAWMEGSGVAGGTCDISRSSFFGNNAPSTIKGVHHLDNVTVALNQGVGYYGDGSITFSTIVHNAALAGMFNPSGGVEEDPVSLGTLVLKNTVVSDNAGRPGGAGLFAGDCAGSIISNDHNYVSVLPVGCTIAGAANDTLGAASAGLNTPITSGITTGMFPSGPTPILNYLDSSDPSCTGTDQFGLARPTGPHCEIGALEF